MNKIREIIRKKRLYFDGGYGTLLQSMGLAPGQAPESFNVTHPEKVEALHRAYIEAGCNFLTTNTFGVNRVKYENYRELIAAAMACAKRAADGRENVYIAFDMGPTGRMLAPLGDLPFEEAVDIYAANVREAVACGADLILIETMNDAYETKAAVLAAKENCDLPVFVTNAYDKSGKLMTGGDPLSMIALLEGLGVDALGMNCSFGPDMMVKWIDVFCENCSLPLIANPNAGMPRVVDGRTVFDISPADFAREMVRLAERGVSILGGCCGTTPEYIAAVRRETAGLPFCAPTVKHKTLISCYAHAVEVGNDPILIGERINPTGKPRLKEALRSGDMHYVLNEGISQVEAGVQVLDVNVGLPDIDEAAVLRKTVAALQAVTDVPLQLDSANPAALEGAMRIYNGKALINSVNGKEESMNAVFPLVKKYGGVVIALTMDNAGIPTTAEGRLAIARRIVDRAAAYGIDRKDIIVDPLCLTVSADAANARVTLEAVRLLHREGLKTSLGVSNVSFGLPARGKINMTFFADALAAGLDCAIINPYSEAMMDVYYAHRVLRGLDPACADYIAYASHHPAEKKPAGQSEEALSLEANIIRGLKDGAVAAAEALLEKEAPIDVIGGHMIPALGDVGRRFEQKQCYLPQLLMSAEAACAAFEKIREKMPRGSGNDRGSVILATVRGDIHDIGKNIVRVLLESYGFHVFDLGRDVPPDKVLEAVQETGCRLVGLSALMTTTVPAMAETIALLHEKAPSVRVVVGGAVLTADYAEKIGADHYSADAMETVRYAEQFYALVEP